jgi:hypothetical protein
MVERIDKMEEWRMEMDNTFVIEGEDVRLR